METRNKWVAVKVKRGRDEVWDKTPTFALVRPREPHTFYWYGMMGHAEYKPSDYEIVEVLGYGIYKEELEIAYRKKYLKPRPSKKLIQSAGWISTNGDFYACQPWEHDGRATNITACLFNSLRGTRLLEEKRWMRIYEDGLSYNSEKLTQKQIDKVFDLSRVGKKEWRKAMRDIIRLNEL